jgi:hypothetical protein
MTKKTSPKIYIISIIILIITGCIQNSKIVSKEYKDQDFTNNTFTVFPVTQNQIVLNSDSLIVQILESDSSYIRESIQDTISSVIYEHLDKYMIRAILQEEIIPSEANIILDDTMNFNEIELSVNDSINTEKFYYPQEEIVEMFSDYAEIVFCFNQIQIIKDIPVETVLASNGQDRVIIIGNTEELLAIKAKYIIWNYMQNKPISYGFIKSYVMIEDNLNPQLFKFAIKNLTDNIFSGTPFDYSYLSRLD